jgi:putative acyl-CoA dehydrogenase
MRCEMLGEEGRGVPTIIEMVTLTRLDCALASAGLMRARVWRRRCTHTPSQRVRQAHLDRPAADARVLADMALDVEAATALVFRLAAPSTTPHSTEPRPTCGAS